MDFNSFKLLIEGQIVAQNMQKSTNYFIRKKGEELAIAVKDSAESASASGVLKIRSEIDAIHKEMWDAYFVGTEQEI